MSDVKKYTVGTINNADPKKYEILVRIFDESVLEAANLNAKKYGIHNGVANNIVGRIGTMAACELL